MTNKQETQEEHKPGAGIGGYWLAAVNSEDPSLGVLDIVERMLNNKLVLLLGLVLGGVLAASLSMLMTPVYRAEVLMMPVTHDSSESALSGVAQRLGGLSSLVGLNADSSGEKHVALATLDSRVFAERFITDLDLMPVFFEDKWDAEAKTWLADNEEDIPTIRDAYAMFDKKIRIISEDQRTGLVSLAIEWKDREAAAYWANEFVSRVNEKIRQDVISLSRRSVEFLNKELAKTSVTELQLAIYGLIEAQVNRAMLANVREEYAFKVIDPAVVSDADQYVRPQRLLLILLGMAAGLTCSVLVVLLRGIAPRVIASGQAEKR